MGSNAPRFLFFSLSCGSVLGMRRVFFFLFLIVLSVPSFAAAQVPHVAVRSGIHKAYERLVFDWPSSVTYTFEKEAEGTLGMTFSKEGVIDFSKVEAQIRNKELKSVQRVEVVSSSPVSVSIYVAAGSKTRHFKAGNKVVVDVYYPDGAASKPSVEAAEKPKQPKLKENPKKEEKKTEHAAPLEGEADHIKVVDTKEDHAKAHGTETVTEAAKEKDTEEKIESRFHPHMISITATQGIGLAVFKRYDSLYIVIDQEDYNIPPQISGPQYKEFGAFEKIDLLEGTAFKMALPDSNLHVYGEGGGLLWRVILTPYKRERAPSVPQRVVEETPHEDTELSWSFSNARRVLDLKDPVIGDLIKVVTMDRSDQYMDSNLSFVDFDVPDVAIGMALRPKVDDLDITVSAKEVTVTRPSGLIFSEEKDVKAYAVQRGEQNEKKAGKEKHGKEKKVFNRIFQFDRWAIGGSESLYENERILMTGLADKDKTGRVQDILTLAKLNLANARGSEAAGLLALAALEMPEIEKGHEFKAMRGAAHAIAEKVDLAWPDLSDPALDYYSEILFWRAYALARVEDWQQAAKTLPEELGFLAQYPPSLRYPMSLVLAEIALRQGDVSTADDLLETMRGQNLLRDSYRASWVYLTGEALRQKKKKKEAKEKWKQLIDGKDDLYRVKAGLALTSMELAQGDITIDQAIDRMERLRYMWRGDELETTIYYRLGQVYIEKKNYEKALSILRSAASQLPDSRIGKKVTKLMTNTFQALFLGDKAKDINPIEAVTLYEEFSELTPSGAEGDKLTWKLAERLMEVDLFKRASDLLEHLVDHRLKGREAIEAALKLTAIQLIDARPESALNTLNKIEKRLPDIEAQDYVKEKRTEHNFLKARALSQLKRPREALSLLNLMTQNEKTTRLRADIAWQAGRWTDAAEALEELVDIENISLTRPPEPEQADMILNWAVALSLSGNRYILSNLRERYMDIMKQTPKAELFEMVTRPRQNIVLADRETIASIVSEVDMFKDFLDNYKK